MCTTSCASWSRASHGILAYLPCRTFLPIRSQSRKSSRRRKRMADFLSSQPQRAPVLYNPAGMKDRIRDTLLVFESQMKEQRGPPSLVKLFMPLANKLIDGVGEQEVADVIGVLRDEIFPYILFGDSGDPK